MYITRRQYDAAVTASGTDPAVAAALWALLEADRENRPHFNVYHIAYYAGAMIAVAAMTILLGNFWHELSGLQISLVALIFGGFFCAIGAYFWRLGPHARIPAGLFITMAASLTPLFVLACNVISAFHWPISRASTTRCPNGSAKAGSLWKRPPFSSPAYCSIASKSRF